MIEAKLLYFIFSTDVKNEESKFNNFYIQKVCTPMMLLPESFIPTNHFMYLCECNLDGLGGMQEAWDDNGNVKIRRTKFLRRNFGG